MLRCLVDDPSLVGQAEPGAPALTKTHAEALLQIADLAADGGLADIEGNLRRGESAAVHDRRENREQVEVGLVKARSGGRAWWFHTCNFIHVRIR